MTVISKSTREVPISYPSYQSGSCLRQWAEPAAMKKDEKRLQLRLPRVPAVFEFLSF